VELENKIGKGGECTVYKATWSMSNVAVKVFQNITEGEDDCCFQELINIRFTLSSLYWKTSKVYRIIIG